MIKYNHILAMTDFSKDSCHSVEVATDLAKKYGAKLTILHVAHDESQFNIVLSKEEYDKIKNRIDDEINKNFSELENKIPQLKEIEYNTIIRRGTPYVEGVLEIEKNIYDLVVLGSHGNSGAKKFFYGSTTEKIARRSHIATMITRT